MAILEMDPTCSTLQGDNLAEGQVPEVEGWANEDQALQIHRRSATRGQQHLAARLYMPDQGLGWGR